MSYAYLFGNCSQRGKILMNYMYPHINFTIFKKVYGTANVFERQLTG